MSLKISKFFIEIWLGGVAKAYELYQDQIKNYMYR